MFFLDLLDFYVVFSTRAACITVSLDSLFHTFPVVQLFEVTVSSFESVVALLVMLRGSELV